jgi:hypothetical protein
MFIATRNNRAPPKIKEQPVGGPSNVGLNLKNRRAFAKDATLEPVL